MAVELSVCSETIELKARAAHIGATLSEILGQAQPLTLLVTARDLDEEWIELPPHASQVQVLRFDVAESPVGTKESYVNIAVVDRTPLAVALMLATAIVLAERDAKPVLDDAHLFGASTHTAARLRREVVVRATVGSVDEAAAALCGRFGLAASCGP